MLIFKTISYLKRHEQQLWIGTSRCAERRALAQALKDGEVGAHKWSSLPFRHFRYLSLFCSFFYNSFLLLLFSLC